MKIRGAVKTAALWSASIAFAVSNASGADVWLYTVAKGFYYEQTTSGGPLTLTNNAFAFQVRVFPSTAGAVSGASVRTPTGAVQALALDGGEFEFRKRYDTRAKLDSNYPEGSYQVTMQTTHDGQRSATLPLTGATFPNAPRILNFAEAQQVNAHGFFVLQWEPFAGGSAGDHIQARIEDSTGNKVFETPDFGKAGALDGRAVFALIDPDTLEPGTGYNATLLFQKNVAQSSAYPDAPGVAYYFTRTSFRVVTSAAAAPDVVSYEIGKGPSFRQTNSVAIIPEAGDEFLFTADVDGAAAYAVASATLRTPSSATLALSPDADWIDYELRESFSTVEALNAYYPAGIFSFLFVTAHDGTRQPRLDFMVCPAPPAPRLNSFDPSQPVRAELDLNLAWDPWTEGKDHDFIQVRIEDKGKRIFETPDFTKSGALNGQSTRAVVPANTLTPGKSYNARIVFKKLVALDTGEYPGALGIGWHFSRTKFDLRTAEPDVKRIALSKGRQFLQRGPGAPEPNAASAFVFRATVAASAQGSVRQAVLQTPWGLSRPLTLEADGETFSFHFASSDWGAVEGVFPDGVYNVWIDSANQGARSLAVRLNGALYPAAPHVSNFSDAQSVVATEDFALVWDAFPGGTAQDFVQVALSDQTGEVVFDTSNYGRNGALDGTSRSALIDAGAIKPGRLYDVRLSFEKMVTVDESSYPGADILAGYFASTTLPLATLGPGHPPQLSAPSSTIEGQMTFTFTAIVGATYQIEGSTNLRDWVTLGRVTAPDNQVSYSHSPGTAAARPHYFYRAIRVP